MRLSRHWLRIAALAVLPLMLFLVIRNIQIDRARTLRHSSPVKALAFVGKSSQLATSDDSMGTLHLWDVPSRTMIWRKGHNSACRITDCFFQQGKMLAHFGADNEMEIWDVQNRRLVRTVSWKNKIDVPQEDLRLGLLSPDGKTLVTTTWAWYGGRLRLWDVATGKLKHRMEDLEDKAESNTFGSVAWSVAFSPDAKMLATGNQLGGVSVWDTQAGKRRARLSGHRGLVSVVFSPDGRFLATGSRGIAFGQKADGEVKLWNVQKGILLRSFTGSGTSVSALAFSPDGTKLTIGTTQGSASVWDVATGQLLESFTAHRNIISSIAFSPDGKTLATGSNDETVKLWAAN